MFKDEMDKGAKVKDKKPALATASVELKSHKGDKNGKKKGVAKYSAVTDGISKEKSSDRLINDVRQKRTQQQKPYIHAMRQ